MASPPADCATLGDCDIWGRDRTAFFCSRRLPAAAIMKCYNWAGRAAADGICVMSGFHSTIERDVWDMLLDGQSPLIKVCARSLPRRPSPAVRRALDAGRLLLISPFPHRHRTTADLTRRRNHFIITHAHRIVCGHTTPGGRLATALQSAPTPIHHLHP